MIYRCLVAFFLVIPIPVLGIEVSLPIVATSRPSDPVMLYGSLTGSDDSSRSAIFSCEPCTAHLSMANTSGKNILLIATAVRIQIEADGVIRSSAEDRGVDDYFFKTDVFLPNSTRVLETKIFSQGLGKNGENASRKLIAEARVIFVQFSDGAIWGDQAAGKEFLEARWQAWDQLQFLDGAYHSGGEQQLLSTLRQRTDWAPYLGDLIVAQANERGGDTAVKELESLLRVGAIHLREMGGLKNVARYRSAPAVTSFDQDGAIELPASTLIRATEIDADLTLTGKSQASCLIVEQDGRFHLERGVQAAPGREAQLEVFESRLTETQLNNLLDIMNQAEIQKMPEFSPSPPASPKFSISIFDLNRGANVQRLGYVVDKQHTLGDAAKTLLPLAVWFHSVSNLDAGIRGTFSTLCVGDPTATQTTR